MRRKAIRRKLLVLILSAILAVILVPLVWCVALSFDRRALTALPEFSLIPHEPTLFNYEVAFKTIP